MNKEGQIPQPYQEILQPEEELKKPEDFLPLVHSSFNVLLTLGNSESKAYVLHKEIEKNPYMFVGISLAAVYRSLSNLAKDGLVESYTDPVVKTKNGLDIVTYKATELGKEVRDLDLTRRIKEAQSYLQIANEKNISTTEGVIFQQSPSE